MNSHVIHIPNVICDIKINLTVGSRDKYTYKKSNEQITADHLRLSVSLTVSEYFP